MGFVERAFTPPGTGGQEAAAQREAAQQQIMAQAAQAPQIAAPVPPTMAKGPEAPPVFQAGAAPGASQRAKITATSMLGAAAAGGQTSRKTLLGQ